MSAVRGAWPRLAAMPGEALYRATLLYRRSRSLSALRAIEHAPQAARPDAVEAQWRALSALLAHAEAHVPYYREVFRARKLRSEDIRRVEDLAELPVLTKEIVRERTQDLVSETADRTRLILARTSGSTGVPLSYCYDRRALDVWEAGHLRDLAQCGWRPGEMIADFWPPPPRSERMGRCEFTLRQIVRRTYQFDACRSSNRALERWAAVWRRVRPRVADGLPVTMARFAEFAERTGVSLPPVRGVYPTGETLAPEHRSLLARVFGGPVFDRYGCSEVRNIASECAHGRMHVNLDFVVLEAAGRAGADDPAPLLVTGLRNYAMPFIRYENGDRGVLTPGECTCGNRFPLMRLATARVNDLFTLSDGNVVHGLSFAGALWACEGVERFQVHQTAPDAITLWVIPSRGLEEPRARGLRAARERIRAIAGADLSIQIREVAEIPGLGNAKWHVARSDVTPAGSQAGGARGGRRAGDR